MSGPLPASRRLARAALEPSSLDVAPGLLGAHLVHDDTTSRVVVRLTEVEAYMGSADPGSHAYRGQTPRTQVMFGPPGHLYVYFTYGMHWCANVVCGPAGQASAVLLRAGEVVEGVEVARSRRPACTRDADLARGPARLTTALGIGGFHNGADLCGIASHVWIEFRDESQARPDALTGPRVGVAGPGGDAARFPWRFWLPGEPTVSQFRPGQPRRRRTSTSERLRLTGATPDAGAPSPPAPTRRGTARP